MWVIYVIVQIICGSKTAEWFIAENYPLLPGRKAITIYSVNSWQLAGQNIILDWGYISLKAHIG